MATYTYYACDLRTGLVQAELPLVNLSGTVQLSGTGEMNADLPLAQLGRADRIEMLFATTPGRMSIVLDRDGVVAGEWIVWKRSRSNDSTPVKLIGSQLASFLERRLMIGSIYGGDQIRIAESLARQGFWVNQSGGAAGSLLLDIPEGQLSGVRRDRTYDQVDGTVGQRMEELAAVDGGFEYAVESEWSADTALRRVQRTFRTYYPLAGKDQPWTLEPAFTQSSILSIDQSLAGELGGSIVSVSLDEDATRLASVAYAIGSGEGVEKIIGRKANGALVAQGYPQMEVSRAWTSVINQPVIDGHAQALLDLSQDPILPPKVTILADGDPSIREISIGDRCQIRVDESANFPDGFAGQVRILGWTYGPPSEGPELVDLEITGLTEDLAGGGG